MIALNWLVLWLLACLSLLSFLISSESHDFEQIKRLRIFEHIASLPILPKDRLKARKIVVFSLLLGLMFMVGMGRLALNNLHFELSGKSEPIALDDFRSAMAEVDDELFLPILSISVLAGIIIASFYLLIYYSVVRQKLYEQGLTLQKLYSLNLPYLPGMLNESVLKEIAARYFLLSIMLWIFTGEAQTRVEIMVIIMISALIFSTGRLFVLSYHHRETGFRLFSSVVLLDMLIAIPLSMQFIYFGIESAIISHMVFYTIIYRGRDTSQKMGLYLNAQGYKNKIMGRYELAMDLYDKSQMLGQLAGDQYILGTISLNIGRLYEATGNIDLARETFDQAMKHFSALEDSRKFLSITHLHLGYNHYLRGELDEAITHYNKAIPPFERHLVGAMNITQLMYGDPKFYTRDEKDDDKVLGIIFNSLGKIYVQKGKLQLSKSQFLKSYQLRKKIGDQLGLSDCLFELSAIEISQNNITRANRYLQELSELEHDTKYKIIEVRTKLARALLYKQKQRLTSKAKAYELLKEVIDLAEDIDRSLTVYAMINTAEILMFELKAFGEMEVFEETKQLTQKLRKYGQLQRMYPILIESLILEAKLMMIEGNAESAYNMLEQAKITAEERELLTLQAKVEQNQEILDSQVDTWINLAERNVPLQDRIERAQLEDYISNMIRVIKNE